MDVESCRDVQAIVTAAAEATGIPDWLIRAYLMTKELRLLSAEQADALLRFVEGWRDQARACRVFAGIMEG